MRFLTKVGLGWWLRRIPDWLGWLGTFLFGLVQLYNSLPPSSQLAVEQVLTGRWKEIALGSLPALFLLVWSQIKSWRATVEPQMVTPAGEKVKLPSPDAPAPRDGLLKRILREIVKG